MITRKTNPLVDGPLAELRPNEVAPLAIRTTFAGWGPRI